MSESRSLSLKFSGSNYFDKYETKSDRPGVPESHFGRALLVHIENTA